MPAKKISVPVTPDMEKALDELVELHALQRPALCTMLLRDALAGRRSALLPKRAPAPGTTRRPCRRGKAENRPLGDCGAGKGGEMAMFRRKRQASQEQANQQPASEQPALPSNSSRSPKSCRSVTGTEGLLAAVRRAPAPSV